MSSLDLSQATKWDLGRFMLNRQASTRQSPSWNQGRCRPTASETLLAMTFLQALSAWPGTTLTRQPSLSEQRILPRWRCRTGIGLGHPFGSPGIQTLIGLPGPSLRVRTSLPMRLRPPVSPTALKVSQIQRQTAQGAIYPANRGAALLTVIDAPSRWNSKGLHFRSLRSISSRPSSWASSWTFLSVGTPIPGNTSLILGCSTRRFASLTFDGQMAIEVRVLLVFFIPGICLELGLTATLRVLIWCCIP